MEYLPVVILEVLAILASALVVLALVPSSIPIRFSNKNLLVSNLVKIWGLFHKTFSFINYGHFAVNYGIFAFMSKFTVKIWP